jgi:thiol:disulfide interchange protein
MRPSSSLRPLLFIGSVVLALTAIVGISQWRAAHAKDIVPWRHDLTEAEAEARAQHKDVFAYFTASWCGPCQEMKRTTWSDDDVRRAIEKHYVPVKIDIDEQRDLAMANAIDGVPTFIVMTDAGQTVRRTDGYMDSAAMTAWVAK